jgi:hypothetical protein
MPKYLLKRRARAAARARRDLPAAATAHAEAARRATTSPSCRKVVSLSVLRPDSGTPGPPPVSSTDSKERKIMDRQEITEEPQDRTGSWVRRHDEYTPQELAGGRS